MCTLLICVHSSVKLEKSLEEKHRSNKTNNIKVDFGDPFRLSGGMCDLNLIKPIRKIKVIPQHISEGRAATKKRGSKAPEGKK